MDGEKLMKARGGTARAPRGPGHISRRRGSDETGSVLVEFALILPIFAAMLFGMIQFGLVFAGWSSLRNSVETSARMLAIGDLPASASVNCTPPNGLNAITSAAYCTVIQEIGTPIGTTGGSSQVGFLVTPGSGTTPTGYVLTVCGQVQAQNLTGVLNLNPSSSSSFLIEDSAMTGPSGIQDYNSSLPGCG